MGTRPQIRHLPVGKCQYRHNDGAFPQNHGYKPLITRGERRPVQGLRVVIGIEVPPFWTVRMGSLNMGQMDMKKSPFVPLRCLMLVDMRGRRLHERK